mgnify:CR=1 FL=1
MFELEFDLSEAFILVTLVELDVVCVADFR